MKGTRAMQTAEKKSFVTNRKGTRRVKVFAELGR